METRIDPYAALRVADFQKFLAMRLAMTMAIQIMSISVGYYVYELTNKPLMLGLIGLAEAIPAISISLYAGHAADKYDRRRILMFCIITMIVCAISLIGLVACKDYISKAFLIGGIYAVISLSGIARGFFSPTNFSFLPLLVEKKDLANAITWNSSTWEVASITGLGLGGILYGFIGVTKTFMVMTAFFLGALCLLLMIKKRPVITPVQVETARQRIKQGLSFVFSNKLIISAIALDLFAVLFGGAVALLPVFAKDILEVGPKGLGILRAAMSLGAIAMTFVLAFKPLGKGAGRLMLCCVAGFGFCMIGFGMSTHFWVSFGFLFMAGVFDEVSVNVRSALIQFQTPDHMKGRVSSVNSIFITSSNEIGAFESGVAATLMGTVPSVIFGGFMTIFIVVFAWLRAPALRDYSMEQNQPKED